MLGSHQPHLLSARFTPPHVVNVGCTPSSSAQCWVHTNLICSVLGSHCPHLLRWLSLISALSVLTTCHLKPNLSGQVGGESRCFSPRTKQQVQITRTPSQFRLKSSAKTRWRRRWLLLSLEGCDVGSLSVFLRTSSYDSLSSTSYHAEDK